MNVRPERIPHPVQRVAGKWAKPPDDVKEPERTERILAHPFAPIVALRTLNAADSMESLSLTCINGKSGGRSTLALTFHWTSMAIQVTLGVLSGMGAFLEANGPGGEPWPCPD